MFTDFSRISGFMRVVQKIGMLIHVFHDFSPKPKFLDRSLLIFTHLLLSNSHHQPHQGSAPAIYKLGLCCNGCSSVCDCLVISHSQKKETSKQSKHFTNPSHMIIVPIACISVLLQIIMILLTRILHDFII